MVQIYNIKEVFCPIGIDPTMVYHSIFQSTISKTEIYGFPDPIHDPLFYFIDFNFAFQPPFSFLMSKDTDLLPKRILDSSFPQIIRDLCSFNVNFYEDMVFTLDDSEKDTFGYPMANGRLHAVTFL